MNPMNRPSVRTGAILTLVSGCNGGIQTSSGVDLSEFGKGIPTIPCPPKVVEMAPPPPPPETLDCLRNCFDAIDMGPAVLGPANDAAPMAPTVEDCPNLVQQTVMGANGEIYSVKSVRFTGQEPTHAAPRIPQ